MKALTVKENVNFIGRKHEIEVLEAIGNSDGAKIIIMYGRRRVGKTELLEQVFRDRNILKFEGIEGLSDKKQLENVVNQLSLYIQKPVEIPIKNWSQFFQYLSTCTKEGIWTIYLEEIQWLANYKGTLIAELKYVWDNFFRHNPNLVLILCGSSASFIIRKVMHSDALYNRSQHEICLKEFNIVESKQFLGHRSNREVFDAYLTIGGIPEYLKWVKSDSSVFLGLCVNSFKSGSFFSREYNRIFVSSLSSNKHYKEIIELLSHKKFLTRQEIVDKLGIKSGGVLTSILLDLEYSGFIEKYQPFNLGSKTILTRYMISDNYLHYYCKFIKPIQSKIDAGDYDASPIAALKTDSYQKWLGFAFERWCRKNHTIIAKILGFSGVHYKSGVFFSRATDAEDKGYQIDLIFDRADNVYTICEIKYLQAPVSTSVIEEFERKLRLFPPAKSKTIHKVLICTEGMDDALERRGYFDNVIMLDDLMDERNWGG